MARISIAMCTFNGAKYLEEQLASIVNQTRLPDELIVCDDCSIDNTTEFLEEFRRKAPFDMRLVVNDVNKGSTMNFQHAIGLCSGDYIALCDQDDIWMPDKLSQCEAILNRDPEIGCVFTDGWLIDEKAKRLPYSLWQSIGFGEREQNEVNSGNSYNVLLKHNVATGAAMMFRKSLNEVVIPFSPKWVHDGWVVLILSSFMKLKAINECLIKYRQHSSQQIGAGSKNMSLYAKYQSSKNTPRLLYKNDIGQCQDMIKRLTELHDKGYKNVDILISLLHEKVTHYETRMNLPEARVRRIKPVLKEIINGHYFSFSQGINSVAKDFLL